MAQVEGPSDVWWVWGVCCLEVAGGFAPWRTAQTTVRPSSLDGALSGGKVAVVVWHRCWRCRCRRHPPRAEEHFHHCHCRRPHCRHHGSVSARRAAHVRCQLVASPAGRAAGRVASAAPLVALTALAAAPIAPLILPSHCHGHLQDVLQPGLRTKAVASSSALEQSWRLQQQCLLLPRCPQHILNHPDILNQYPEPS